MGNLLGSWRFKEPSTVEECDSTWGSDSESDEPAAEDDSGISDSINPADYDRAAGDTSPQVHRRTVLNACKGTIWGCVGVDMETTLNIAALNIAKAGTRKGNARCLVEARALLMPNSI